METIRTATVKARRIHVCDYCGCEIPKGERYKRSVNVFDGKPYTWKSHLRCAELCGKIWDYVDPDEGMTGESFIDAVQDLIHPFYCPFHCDEYDRDTLDREYKRDMAAGLGDVDVPKNYYIDDDPDKGPLLRWRSSATLMYTNWLNYYVYQETPFDISSIRSIRNEDLEPNRDLEKNG